MIYGERVRLRAIEREDLAFFVEWLNDPEVTAGLIQVLPLSMAQEEEWFNEILKRPDYEKPLAIEILQDLEWKLVGDLGFFNVNMRVRSAELGIFIGEKGRWDQGIGTEAVRLMLMNGFDTLNLNRISLEVFENNLRAIHVYEKVGFTTEGLKRQAMYKDGEYLNVLIMSILRDEWPRQEGGNARITRG